MKVNTISRYGIVPILQHGQQSPYLKDLCIRLIQSSVSFSLRDKHNESRQDFQLLGSRKIATWPAKPQVLGDHVRKYTTELSVSGIDHREHTKSRSVSYMDNRNGKRRRDTHHIELWSRSPFESDILNILRRDQEHKSKQRTKENCAERNRRGKENPWLRTTSQSSSSQHYNRNAGKLNFLKKSLRRFLLTRANY